MELFTVDSVNIMTQSYLDIHNETCPICRCNVIDKCLECLNLNEEAECKSVLGECNHAYHIHCIQTWLKTKKVCPLDNKTWVFMKHCNNTKCKKVIVKNKSNTSNNINISESESEDEQ
jgi:hypothetical protein